MTCEYISGSQQDELVRLLCEVRSVIEFRDPLCWNACLVSIKGLDIWIKTHDASEERIRTWKEGERKKSELAKSALSKLTAEERAAIGI